MIVKSVLRFLPFAVVVVLPFSLFVTLVPSLAAQTSATGALSGTVTDASGAVVPNATVTATSLDTGQARNATTGADGTYRFTLLPPGNYRVRIEATGFKPIEVPSATVSVTETAVLDRSLEVGAQTQTVTVESEVVAVQTESSALGTIATSRTVTELPLNTRNYTNLLAMSAGVSGSVSDATQIGKGATNMQVNGANNNQNTYLLNGMVENSFTATSEVSDGVFIGNFAMPNPDAIAEFKIQTSSYDAGYGRNPGANVNVITKSGTNDFHGSAFEFFRNTALNANSWFLNRTGTPKPVLNANQYGGDIGGPIKKNKVFFFLDYQESNQKNGYSAFSQSTTFIPPIPTGNRGACNGGKPGWYSIVACDAAGQTFITQLATIFSSGKPKQGAVRIQNPSACPAGGCDSAGLFNINPVAINLLQLKLPNGGYYIPSSGTSGYAPVNFIDPATFADHQGIGNLDYVINNKHTLSLRYTYEGDDLNAPFGAANSAEPSNGLDGVPVTNHHGDTNALARLTSILSNNLVNEFSVGYERDFTPSTRSSLFTNSQVGIQDFVSPFASGGLIDTLSAITVGGGPSTGLFSTGTFISFGGYSKFNLFDIDDQVSWTHRSHTFRTGVGVQRAQVAWARADGAAGTPTFQSFPDLLVGRAGCGPGVLVSPSALNPAGCNGGSTSNVKSSGGIANSPAQTNPRDIYISAFLQDDIKVNARLTLNLGVRWELDQFPTETQGNFSDFWPSLATVGSAPLVTFPGGAGQSLAGFEVPSNYSGVLPAGVYRSRLPYYTQSSAPWDDFAPRIGFAWQPTSSNRLVLRGGAGFFYDVPPGFQTAAFYNNGPLHIPSANGAPAASLSNPWALPAGVVSAGPGYGGFAPLWVDPSTVVTVAQNPVSPCLAPPCSSNTSPVAWDPNMTVPVTYQWNLNTQYQFVRNWVLEVGYVGSHGIHQATPGAVSGPTADSSAINSPYNVGQLAGVGAPCISCQNPAIAPILAAQGNTVANAILRVPYLGISPNATSFQTNSNYKYNGLQLTVRKQFSKGFQLQAAYTWSRGFEQAPQGVNAYPYVEQTYSPEYFVRPHRLIANYVWNLPLGHQQGFLGKVTDGWSWSGVITIQDGAPQDIVDSSGGAIFGATASLAGTIGHAQLCPGMTFANVATSGSTEQRVTNALQGGDGWINSAAFCAPPSNIGAVNGVGGGTGFGTAGAGYILGPGQDNWDMTLAKLIKIRESQSLQFRAEFFNTFNHPQFSSINDTDANDRAQNGGGLGTITTLSVNPRVLQFALKYLF